MIHQNLVLTEEAIKGHCKRLKKKLQLLGQDLSLTQVQNLFAESLGFNNWHHLYVVLRLDNKKHVHDSSSTEKRLKNVAILSSSDLIRKSIKLFLGSEKYNVDIFIGLEDFIKSNHPYNYIISDTKIETTQCPVIYLVNKEEDVFYHNLSKLFYRNKYDFIIDDLKKYININKGQVDIRYWKLLLLCLKTKSDVEGFKKIALHFYHRFIEDVEFENFDFIVENESDYSLGQPLSKSSLLKVISYMD